jgi:hypothetical protein
VGNEVRTRYPSLIKVALPAELFPLDIFLLSDLIRISVHPCNCLVAQIFRLFD